MIFFETCTIDPFTPFSSIFDLVSYFLKTSVTIIFPKNEKLNERHLKEPFYILSATKYSAKNQAIFQV